VAARSENDTLNTSVDEKSPACQAFVWVSWFSLIVMSVAYALVMGDFVCYNFRSHHNISGITRMDSTDVEVKVNYFGEFSEI
jgi:hypothetical protein